MYEVENSLRSENLNENIFLEKRKTAAAVILKDFRKWLLKRQNELLPSSLLGEAVGYTLNQWDKLVAYLESPYLTPDNNAAENGIRPFVLGRNYVLNISMCSYLFYEVEIKVLMIWFITLNNVSSMERLTLKH